MRTKNSKLIFESCVQTFVQTSQNVREKKNADDILSKKFILKRRNFVNELKRKWRWTKRKKLLWMNLMQCSLFMLRWIGVWKMWKWHGTSLSIANKSHVHTCFEIYVESQSHNRLRCTTEKRTFRVLCCTYKYECLCWGLWKWKNDAFITLQNYQNECFWLEEWP